MKKLIILWAMLLPALASAQLQVRIDSIDYSNFTDIVEYHGSVTFMGDERPVIQIVCSVQNTTDESITLFPTWYNRPSIFIQFPRKGRPYYRQARWLDERPRQIKTSEEYPDISVSVLPGDLVIQPHETIRIKIWSDPPVESNPGNEWLETNPYWWNEQIEDCKQWFLEVLPSLRVIIYYGLETGVPKVLLSPPLDMQAVEITGNML